MNYFSKTGLLLGTLLLIGGGCINITINGVDIPLDELNDETSVFVDGVSDTIVYGNSAGYSFRYPDDLVLWSKLNVEEGVVVEATEEDESVTLSEQSVLLFQAEVNTLRFTTVKTIDSPIEWARREMDGFYSIENGDNLFGDKYSFVETRVQGREALDVYGGANIGSNYRTLVIDLGEELLVIEQGLNDIAFDEVFANLIIE